MVEHCGACHWLGRTCPGHIMYPTTAERERRKALIDEGNRVHREIEEES